MSSVLIIGSVALDTVQTPEGTATEELGGSASYASLAAAFFTRAHMVGVVGTDFPARHRRMFQRRGIHLNNLIVAEGKTFRWSGSYEGAMGSAKTHQTCLNVFETFRPTLQPDVSKIPYVFLANIDPDLQNSILDQMSGSVFIACDTMNYWIESKRDSLEALLRRVHCALMNEEEIRSFTREMNLPLAARQILDLGPQFVIIKRGEHGASVYWKSGQVCVPAFPVTRLVDPTGAGDTLAGSLIGWISRQKRTSNRVLVEAVVVGTAMASFTCEGFGVKGLLRASPGRLVDRCLQLKRMCDLPIIRIRKQ